MNEDGWRYWDPIWRRVEHGDTPLVRRQYLMVVAQGRHEEAEQLVREAMDSCEGP